LIVSPNSADVCVAEDHMFLVVCEFLLLKPSLDVTNVPEFYKLFYSARLEVLLLLHPFNGLFSSTTRASWYRKGKTSLGLNEARDGGFLDTVASAGPCANSLHLAADR